MAFVLQDMKEMLYKIVEEAPSAESTDPVHLHRLFIQFDEHFLQYCEKELAKINVFYSGLYHIIMYYILVILCFIVTSLGFRKTC